MKNPLKFVQHSWQSIAHGARATLPLQTDVPSVQLQTLEDRILYDASPLTAIAVDLDSSLETLEDIDQQIDQLATTSSESNHVPPAEENNSFIFGDSDAVFNQARQLIVIDERVDDLDSLIEDVYATAGAEANFDIVRLDESANGVEEISAALSKSLNRYDAVHIVAHGSDAKLQLGATTLDHHNLEVYKTELSSWTTGMALGADILLYGCDLAQTNLGQDFVNQIADWTGADIAASDDLTGHAKYGGDWELEYVAGVIESSVAFSANAQASWIGMLDITSNLVLHQTFDTNANDSSGNNYDGTLNNGAYIGTNPATNQIGPGKLNLDGVNDYVDLSPHINNFQDLTQGTISAWVKTTTTDGTIFAVSDSGDTNSSALIYLFEGKLAFSVSEGHRNEYLLDVVTQANINDNAWHHVAVAVGPTGNRLFIDGVQATSLTYYDGNPGRSDFFSNVSRLDTMTIGANWYDSNLSLVADGLLDDVRVYDRALSNSDIDELFNYRDVIPPNQSGIEVTDLTYNENDAATQITNTIAIEDPNDTNLESAVITISSNYAIAEDTLTFTNTSSINGVWDANLGTLNLTGSDSLANYELALRSITYQNISDSPSTLGRTVSFTVNDGDVDSNTLTRNINILQSNDAPVLSTIETPNLEYIENDAATQITNTLTLTDVDDIYIDSANVDITGNFVSGEDVLAFANMSLISGIWDAELGKLSLSGRDTLANYETAIRSITYQNMSELPSTQTRTVAFTVNDGSLNSSPLTRDIEVTSINDDPSNSGTTDGNAVVIEDTPTGLDLSEIDLVDLDENGGSLVVTIKTTSGGSLSSTSSAGVSVSGNGTNSLELVGSLTSLNAFLNVSGNVNFTSASNAFGINIDEITVEVNDSGNTGVGNGGNVLVAAFNIESIPVNDAPEISALSGDAISAFNDGTVKLLDSSLPAIFNDPYDATEDLDGGWLQISGNSFEALDSIGLDTTGIITLSAGFTDGSVISVGGVNIGSLSGVASNAVLVSLNNNATVDRTESLIHAVTFQTTSEILGLRTVDFTINDGDGTENGGFDTSSIATVNVIVGNAGGGLVSTMEDSAHIFSLDDFEFTGTIASSFRSLTIIDLPIHGTLMVNGVPIVTNQMITEEQITAGLFEFLPNNNDYGDSYASFNFYVNNGNNFISVLSGESSPFTLNGGSLPETDSILADANNFGASGIYPSSISVAVSTGNIDSAYLAQGDILFDGYTEDFKWTASELGELNDWVNAGGILISTNDDAGHDGVSDFYGLTIGGKSSPIWHVQDPDHPIMNGPFGQVGDLGDPFEATLVVFSYFDSDSLEPDDHIIAVDSASGEPTIVLRQVGSGWVVFTADEGIFRAGMTGAGTVATPNDILAANIFAWASNQVPASSFHSMEIDVTPVNDAPKVSLNNLVDDIDENTDTQTQIKIADIQITDDELGTNDLILSGVDATFFEIIGNELYLKAGTPLDFETKPSFDVIVEVDDPSIGITPDDSVAYSLTVNDINEPPSITLTNVITSLFENVDTSTPIKIADIVVTDDALGTNELTLTGSDVMAFEIVGTELHLRAGTILDFETQTELNVTVLVDDPELLGDPEDSIDHRIDIVNANDPPTLLLTNLTFSINENSDTTSSIKIADIVITDDDLGINNLSLTGSDASYFEIVDLELRLRSGTILNFEAKETFDVNVEIDDTTISGTPDALDSHSLNVTDINEAPTELLPSDISLPENTDTTGGLPIATLTTLDVDRGDTFTYELVGGSGQENFSIIEDKLLFDDGILDFETRTNYSVTIRATDSGGLTHDEVVTISITNENEAPFLTVNNTATLDEGNSVLIDSSLLAASDYEQGPADLTYTVTALPANGTLLIGGTIAGINETFTQADINAGIFSYAHSGNEAVSDSFTFSIHDSLGAGITGLVFNFELNPINDAPIAVDDIFSMLEDDTLSGDLISPNDTDAEFDQLTAKLLTEPATGNVLTLDANGTFSYTPALNFHGTETITYQVDDGNGGVAYANLSITVIPVNDAPQVENDSFSVLPGQPFASIASVLDNDSDVDGDALVAILISGAEHGSLTLKANGQFVYTPDSAFFGLDRFTYLANDGTEGTLTTVEIEVLGVVVPTPPGPTTPTPTTPNDGPVLEEPNVEPESEQKDTTVTTGVPVANISVPVVNLTNQPIFQADGELEDLIELMANQDRAQTVLRMILSSISIEEANELVGNEELDRIRNRARFSTTFNANYIWNELDEMATPNSVLTDFRFSVGAITSFGGLGYILWSLRGGAMVAVALAQLPSWRMIDPLPILENFREGKIKNGYEQVDSFFS